MAVDGGPADGVLTCPEDGVETRLRCRDCQAPICPDCFVRTPVGLRCRTCGSDTVPVGISTGQRRRRSPVVAGVAVVVALVAAGAAWAVAGGGPPAADDAAVGGQGVVRKVDPVTIGRGDLANGASWTLVARREGMICYTLTISTQPARPELCRRPPGNRPFTTISRLVVNGPGGTEYLTVGLVSDQVEQLRLVPEGTLGGIEVPTVGGDAGLGGRFFVGASPVNGAVVITALSGNGSSLGRANVAALRPPPAR